MIILRLPRDLQIVLLEWLTIIDLSSLDISVTFKRNRFELLELFTWFKLEENISGENVEILQWLENHQVIILSLCVTGGKDVFNRIESLQKYDYYQHQMTISFLQTVETLELFNWSIPTLVQIGNFRTLRSLSLKGPYSFSEQNVVYKFNNYFQQCVALESLKLSKLPIKNPWLMVFRELRPSVALHIIDCVLEHVSTETLFQACKNLKTFGIIAEYGTVIDETVISQLGEHAPGLTSLTLGQLNLLSALHVSNALFPLQQLTELDLLRCEVSILVLQLIAKSPCAGKLKVLAVSDVNDECMDTLARYCTQLTSLNISLSTAVTGPVVATCSKHFPLLTSLDLTYVDNKRLLDQHIVAIAQHCPRLQSLILSKQERLTNHSISMLLHLLQQLNNLVVDSPYITIEAFRGDSDRRVRCRLMSLTILQRRAWVGGFSLTDAEEVRRIFPRCTVHTARGVIASRARKQAHRVQSAEALKRVVFYGGAALMMLVSVVFAAIVLYLANRLGLDY